MNILITGGTGLIGRALIDSRPTDHFTVLTRSPDHAAQSLPSNTRCVSSLEQLTQSHDNYINTVVNLAGEPIIDKRWSKQQKEKICDSRWNTTEHLVRWIKSLEQSPDVLISASAIGYYGPGDNQTLTESNSVRKKDFPHNLCAKWEMLAKQATSACRVCILRTGIVLSGQGGALSKMTLPFKLGLGGPIGNGKQFMSWIHITDMVRAINFMIENDSTSGTFNLTAPNPVSNFDFTQTLAQTLHRFAILPVPAIALKMLMGESSSLLLTGQNIIPKALLDKGFEFAFPSLDKALADVYRA